MKPNPAFELDFDPNDLIHPKNYGVGGQPHAAWKTLREHAPVHRIETRKFSATAKGRRC